MLNWIWAGLVVIAVAVAAGRDINEIATDRFRNDASLPCAVVTTTKISPTETTINAVILTSYLRTFYHSDDVKNVTGDSVHLIIHQTASGIGTIALTTNVPKVWQDMAAAQGDEKQLSGMISTRAGMVLFTPDPVRYRILAKVANEGILKTADTAVTIALGLIGVMALWLGIMKIAEAAGLVTLLARMAKPVMVLLFPDVPPEHPAMGAMLSNMAANMLGLSNAATPLGLKAMEELNKLNPNPGIATDAMCMFLTINTSAITLIPATVIAIRVSLGSHEPSDIIVPTLLATTISVICAVIFNRLIQRFFPVRVHD